MRIGILADIHEEVDLLRSALNRLVRLQCDRLVMLGDVVQMGDRLKPTVDLLRQANCEGVYGNHELGLCHQPSPRTLQLFPATVNDYFATLLPQLDLPPCRFCHGAPWRDPTDPVGYYSDEPVHGSPSSRAYLSTDCPQVTFMGHLHCWQASTEDGMLPWSGEDRLTLEPAHRYLVTVHAVQDGWAACYDTQSAVLTPLRI